MAWLFLESKMGQIHSTQGLIHNYMLDKITSWDLEHG